MIGKRVRSIALLYETEEDLVGIGPDPAPLDETHYHWREPEEIDAVASSLIQLGFDVHRVGSLERLLDAHTAGQRFDLAWNLSIRTTTRSRTAVSSALLEVLGIPYTGADAVSRAVTLNKDLWKPIARQHGVVTPDWECYGGLAPVPPTPPWPEAIIKPVCEGYSLGLSKYPDDVDASEFRDHVRDVHDRFKARVLCERFIAGRECVVAVVGHIPGARLMSITELTTPEGAALGAEIVGTGAKRAQTTRRTLLPHDAPAAAPMADAATELMMLFGPADYATFDFRVDKEGHPFLIDINLDATLHPRRALGASFVQAGVPYDTIVKSILDSALLRAGLAS